MQTTDAVFGFVAVPLAVVPSSRFVAARPLCPRAVNFAPKRTQRARFVALGPAPTPQDPDAGDPESVERVENEDGAEPEETTADDILNSPSFLKKKLEIVQKELIEARRALDEDKDTASTEKDRYVRLAADFENFRRRSAADLHRQEAKSVAKVCKEILSVLDNFERAIEAVVVETDREKVIHDSYQAINKQLLESLTKLKVEAIDAIGQSFDPEIHDAIQQLESADHAEGLVCAQYQRGYMIGDSLIRAAIVGVSQGPGPENGATNGATKEGEEEKEEKGDESTVDATDAADA